MNFVIIMEESYDADNAADALRDAANALSCASSDGVWDDDVDRISWGIVVQRAVEVSAGTRCADCGAEPGTMDWDDDECTAEPTADYELRDVPDLAERIAEVLRDRPAAWEHVQRLMAVATEPLVAREPTADDIERAKRFVPTEADLAWAASVVADDLADRFQVKTADARDLDLAAGLADGGDE